MLRKILSILFYIIGGFFVYMVCLLAFTNLTEVGTEKFLIIGGFSLPALLFLFIGAAIYRFKNWKSSVGITLLSGVCLNLLVVITFICLLFTPEMNEFFPENQLQTFNDYLSGAILTVIMASLGIFLIKKSK